MGTESLLRGSSDPKKQEKVNGQREERRKDKLIKNELARSPL